MNATNIKALNRKLAGKSFLARAKAVSVSSTTCGRNVRILSSCKTASCPINKTIDEYELTVLVDVKKEESLVACSAVEAALVRYIQ